jgi:hypothetical protein
MLDGWPSGSWLNLTSGKESANRRDRNSCGGRRAHSVQHLSVENPSLRNHGHYTIRVVNVQEWIRLQENKVSDFTSLDGSE